MLPSRLLTRAAIVSLLALPLAACATSPPSPPSNATPSTSSPGRAKLSTKKLCEAAGGTYTGKTCNPASKSTSAEAICEAHGGIYMTGEDYCDIPYSQ